MALQNVEAVIEAIKKIDKDKLSEREFFSHGLEAISQLGSEGIHIDNQYDYRRVSQALKEAGFDDYEIWKEAKLAKGEPVLEGKDFSLDRGDVEIAASWVATFIRDHDGANYVIERSIAKSGKTSNVEVWLEANKKMIELENQETKELEIEIDEQDKGPEIETQIKEELPEIEIPGGMDLDDAIILLFKQPNDVKAIFNGHEITSEMTEDEIYREVLGKTKEEIEARQEALKLKAEKDEQEAKIADLQKELGLDKEDRQPEDGGRREGIEIDPQASERLNQLLADIEPPKTPKGERRPRRGAGIGEGGYDR